MIVLVANNDQYKELNNYKNGIDTLTFCKDAEGNWVVGEAVLDYEPFAPIHDMLNALPRIEYITPQD
jgi:hypothetical protein